MSVSSKLSALVVGDPVATAEAKAARLERKAADAKADLAGLAEREAAAKAALAQAVADEGDSKAAARDLASLGRERDALRLEAEAADEAAGIARRAVSELRERLAREEAEAAVAKAAEAASKARKVVGGKLRDVRDSIGSAWAEESRARALAKAAGLEVAGDLGLDLGAVCRELDDEIRATNPPRGTAPEVPLSLRILRF